MSWFIQSLAFTMIAIGGLSFVLMLLSLSTAEMDWLNNCWNSGWSFVWGGSVLLVLDSIRELLAAQLK